jgi:hypothetical protein
MPQQTTRVVMRLTAHPKLRSITVPARPPIRRVRTPPDPAEPSIEKSGPQVAPPVRGVIFRVRVERVDR